MAEVAILDLCDRIRPYVGQCPEETIRFALVEIMRDFCNFTRAYQAEDSDTIQALVPDYDIETPNASTEPVAIEDMTVDRTPCYPKDAHWLTNYVARDWRTRPADDFRYYTMVSALSFAFPCVPTKMGSPAGVQYRASYRPKLTAATIDDMQANEWLETWTQGALWKLKGMGGTEPPRWFDREASKEHGRTYLSERGAARIRVSHSRTNTGQRFINRKGFA